MLGAVEGENFQLMSFEFKRLEISSLFNGLRNRFSSAEAN